MYRKKLWAILAAVVMLAVLTVLCTKGAKRDRENIRSLEPPADPPALGKVWAGPQAEPEAEAQESTGPLEVTLSELRSTSDSLVFQFSHAMIDTVGEPKPKLMVKFDPHLTGKWMWKSPTELVFTPDKGLLTYGQQIEVSIPQAMPLAGEDFAIEGWGQSISVPFMTIAGKVAEWTIQPGMPRFMGLLNWNTMQIGRGPLFILYDQKVEPSLIGKFAALSGSDSEKQLAFEIYRPKSAAAVTDENINLDQVLALSVKEPLDNYGSLALMLPSWENGAEPESVERTLEVRTSFTLDEITDVYEEDGRIPHTTRIGFRFSSRYKEEGFKNSFKITPEPLEMYMEQSMLQEEYLSLTLKPGTKYRFRIDSTFTDILGNRFSPALDTVFFTRDLQPLLEASAEPLVLESAKGLVPIRVRNCAKIVARVYRFADPRKFLSVDWQNMPRAEKLGFSSAAASITVPSDSLKSNTIDTVQVRLGKETGLLLVEIEAAGTGSESSGQLRTSVLVQNTPFAVTAKLHDREAFVWVTDLASAQPLPGAAVEVIDEGGTVASGVTDERGIARLPVKNLISSCQVLKPALVAARKDGAMSAVLLKDEYLSQAWQYGLKGVVQGAEELYASIFTERGVYRPGDTAHVKVIAGGDLPVGQLDLIIKDPRGQQLISETLALDAFGHADLDVPLKKHAPVGLYMIQVSSGELKTVRQFAVEEYRVPTFQVKASSAAEQWKRGEQIGSTLRADYLHGGPLDGRQIRWEVLRKPAPFAPPAFPKYLFRLGDPARFEESVISGSGSLNAQGELYVSFTADHPPSAGPMTYVVEGNVTDIDRQTYAGRLSRIVHPAHFYIGVLQPPSTVLKTGQELTVPVVAVSQSGKPLEGIKVRVRLERIDHHSAARLSPEESVQHVNREVPQRIEDQIVITEKTAALASFVMPAAGQYRLRAWAQDTDHQLVQAGFEVWATGDNPAAWPRFDTERIEVIADRAEYKPGDTARLVVQTPYKQATGLLTIEQGDIFQQRVFTIDNNTPALEIPISEDFVPNCFVSAVLVRGRIHDETDAQGFETGAPGVKIGYAKLAVTPTNRRLQIAVTPEHAGANPGQATSVVINVKDHRGRPVAGQATIMVVDEAVLGLTGYKTPDPVSELYAQRGLAIRTASNILDLPHSRRARFERLFAGGGADGGSLLFDFPMELRSLFKSTAYWNPTVTLDAQGKAKVSFSYPDNLTTYRIMVVASDSSRNAGSAEQKVTVRKPLMVKPVAPRFFYPDDSLELQALVFNASGAAGEVELMADLEGFDLGGNSRQSATVKNDSSRIFSFPVKVLARDAAVIRFGARIGDKNDAVEIRIPVLSPGTKRTVVEAKSVTGTDSVTVPVPAQRVAGSMRMEAVISSTVLSELKGAVQYLMQYPNGCIEQTTSTAYPLVVLKDLLPEIGIEVNQEDLKKFSEAGVKRILSFQTSQGGLSYWPGGTEPHAFATAFGLTALIEAKKKGYDVPDQALDGMADYLLKSLKQGKISGEMPHGGMADGDTRALFVMTLGRMGRPQPNYISALWREKAALTPFGLSFLAIAVKEMGTDLSLLDPILAEIRKAAKIDKAEAWYDGANKGGWSMDSPLRTHAGALLAYASSSGSGDMPGKLLTGFLNRREDGLWGNTQENVFGIMGVHSFSKGQSGGSSPQMQLVINGERIADARLQKVGNRVRRFSLGESDLVGAGKPNQQKAVLTNDGGIPLFLTMRMEYEVPLTKENRQAVANGFSLVRTYETIEGKSLEKKTVPLGSLVRIRLKVKTDKDLHYVAIDDKLPAGLEPLNTTLQTTERVSMGELSTQAQRAMSVLSYQEIRDSRVAFYADEMLANEYEFIYIARATTAGTFLRPAGRAEAMYEPEICGTTQIDEVTIR